MDSLSDYVQWMSDIPISVTGFRDADALVLCALSYIDFSPLFSLGDSSHTLRDCRDMIESNQVRVMIVGKGDGYPELLAQAAESRRFGEMRIHDYCDLLRPDPPLQFSALCFSDVSGLSFLAFRGTDNSLAGWKEDFMIGFTRTEAQKLAEQYAQEHISADRRWIIGGHSKGGNLALYAACLLPADQWAAVDRLYLLDGPGFCPEVLDQTLIPHIESKTSCVLPGFSIIGKLFKPEISDTKIVRSSSSGFSQHDIISWGIDHGKLALLAEHDPFSLVLNQALGEWISGMSQEERGVLVNELFEALAAGGAKTLDDLKGGNYEALEAVLRGLGDFSPTARRTLYNLPRYAFKAPLDILRSHLPAEWAAWKKS